MEWTYQPLSDKVIVRKPAPGQYQCDFKTCVGSTVSVRGVHHDLWGHPTPNSTRKTKTLQDMLERGKEEKKETRIKIYV